jgi:hypothetical protein
MVSALLNALYEGKTFSQFELAERLCTNPETITAGIDFLQRAGYVKRVCMPQNCGMKCAGCPVMGQTRGNCPVLWELIKKQEE